MVTIEEETAKIRKIVTTFGLSSLEAPFFNALLSIERVRRALNISAGLEWDFQSTATLKKPSEHLDFEMLKKIMRDQGIVHFNLGNAQGLGTWDQHGRPENESLCTLCSMDLVREDYDFLNRRPWLREIYRRVRDNDVNANSLSENKDNLRRLMEGFSLLYPNDSQKILDLLTIAFRGIFEQCKNKVSPDVVFDIDQILTGVKGLSDVEFNNFALETFSALTALSQDWQQAKEDVNEAIQSYGNNIGLVHPVLTPITGKNVRLLFVNSDARSAGAAARRKNFDIVFVQRSTGHFQLFGSNIEDPNSSARYRLALNNMAHALRVLEARTQGKKLEQGRNWNSTGFIYFEDGDACPIYLAEFLSALFNGSLSSPDVPCVLTPFDNLKKCVINNVKRCELLIQIEEGQEWEHYKP